MPALFALLCLLGVLFGAYQIWSDRPYAQPPGVLAPDIPIQEDVAGAPTFSRDGFTIKPLAAFDVRARVLSRERYRWDAGAKLSPVDLALGWGPMSDTSVIEHLDLSQDHRWYQFRTQSLPLPADQLMRHSSNMHMIPADRGIANAMRSVRKGQIVRFKGKLVEVSRRDGFVWRSSLSREDTGRGACELVYVERFEVE
jgi:hypothetical protein